MLENNQKGWHGCYSRFGKSSVEQFNEIMKKDVIFERLNKKIKVKDFFTPDKEINKLDYIEDNLKVFQIYENELKAFSGVEKIKIYKNNERKNKKISEIEYNNKNMLKTDKFKYHNIHKDNDKKKKLNRIISIPTFRHNIKYDLIFNRLLSGPQWDKMKGRKYPKITIDNRDYLYNDKNNFLNEKGEFKCRVNMDKSTKRGEFLDLKDIRLRSDKAFTKEKKHKIKLRSKLLKNLRKEKDNNNKNIKSLSKTKTKETELPSIECSLILNDNSNNNNNNIINNQKNTLSLNKSKTISHFNFKKYKNKNKNKNKKFKTKHSTKYILNKNNTTNDKSLKSCLSEPKIPGPDFKKYLTRKYLERLRTLHSTNFLVSYVSPNYSQVTERFNTNVKYDNIDNKKTNNKRKQFIGIEPNFFFDPNKDIDKYNNHLSIKVPNFNLMSSRFYKNNNKTLPCYMQNNFQRVSCDNINGKTLEINGYSNRDLSSSKSSFFPKKSFNNIINLNLINSSIFKNKIKNEEVKEKINIIKNEISFNHKGYEDLIKEGALNRFDGVTYKSINRKNNLNLKNILYKQII